MTDPDAPTSSSLAGTASGGLPTFVAGERVAGRYTIIRFIARGGMGEVYEAEDLELGTRVALKTIRAEVAPNERALERFKREILLARKVTHPNVCRIFDLGRHPGTVEDVVFFTMELLEGETLADRLRRSGRLVPEQARPLVSQMVAALSAAHHAGIVHRDFKSANVMLVAATEVSQPRVVVTDFGLAQAPTGSLSEAVTGTAGIGGTPAYMAPEQVRGGVTTPATDIYALGIVLYEMLTGSRPFEGDTPLALAARRLTEKPRPLRSVLPEIEPRWESVVQRCLEREPAARFAHADDVWQALQDRPAGPRRWPAAILVGALLVGGVIEAVRASRPPAPEPSAQAARRSVAVLGFKNLSGRPESAWLSTALAEMLTTELAAGEKLRTLPGEEIAHARSDLRLLDVDTLSPESLARIRRHLRTDVVVVGSYLVLGGEIRLDLRLQDTALGETIATLAESGTESALFDLVRRAGGHLRVRLGVGLTPDEAQKTRAALPANTEAARWYAEGLGRLRLYDSVAARDLLQRAVAADPAFAPARSALAEAWTNLGYDRKAAELARQAFDLSAGLPREERLLVEGRHREAAKDWSRAAVIYDSLFRFFPDNLEYGFRLTATYVAANRSPEALATIAALRALPAPAREDPRIDLAEARAASSMLDYQRALRAARRCAEGAERIGARLLVARARHAESWALIHLGQLDAARQALDATARIYAETGRQDGAATVLTDRGIVLWRQGDVAAAAALFEQGLQAYRALGNEHGAARALNYLAITLVERRQLRAAERPFAQALEAFRSIDDKEQAAWCLNNLGEVLRRQGRLEPARGRYAEALAEFTQIQDRRGATSTQINIALVDSAGGLLKPAEDRLASVLAGQATGDDRSLAAYAHAALGQLRLACGDLAAARKSLDEALAIRSAIGEKATVAETRVALSRLLIEEGRSGEAEGLVRQALATYAGQQADDEVSAQAVLADALLAQNKPLDARQAAQRAVVLARGSESPEVRIEAGLAEAGTQNPSPAALAAASSLLAEAHRLGLLGLELEARLRAAKIELAAGDRSAGRARLQALAADAKADGFGLIAGTAGKLLRR